MRRSLLTRGLTASVPLLFSACATIAPPQPPSLDLPKPPSDLRASRKGQQVTLTWTLPEITTDRRTIRSLGPTQICRNVDHLRSCGTPVGETPALPKVPAKLTNQKPQRSYTDVLPASIEIESPEAFATYAVEVLNTEGRGGGLSNQVSVPLLPSLAPPQDFRANVTKEGIVLRWSESIPKLGAEASAYSLFRIYRRSEENPKWSLLSELRVRSDNDTSLTDSTIEWEKTYLYRIATVNVIAVPSKPKIEVEGDDSPTVKIFADDVFPPAVPTQLQAIFSGPGQKPFIDLIWAPVTDVDLAGYNIYRSENGSVLMKLNSAIVRTPAYQDASVEQGIRYSYSVSSVDLRGNESARSATATETVP